MTSLQSGFDEPINELLSQLFDGELDDNEFGRLSGLIRSDSRVRQLYCDYVALHAMLRWRSGDSGQGDPVHSRAIDHSVRGDPPSSSSPIAGPGCGALRYFSSDWPVAYLVATVICGIGLAIGAMTHVSQPIEVITQSSLVTKDQAAPESKEELVGRITGMVDCRWGDETNTAMNGAYILLGRKYALASGLMEITYDTGARVILQGPVTYEVESPSGGYLSVGKLTAKLEKRSSVDDRPSGPSRSQRPFPVPNSLNPNLSPSAPNAPLFTIRTPTVTVTDLGTEFGVEVSRSGATSAYVFRGVVEVCAGARGGESIQAIRLTENESIHVERSASGTTMNHGGVDPAVFARVEHLSAFAEEPLNTLRRWQAYGRKLCQDSALVAYYDFQREDKEPSVLRGVSKRVTGSVDGRIEGAKWSTGHFAGKHSLSFDGSESRVRISLPGTWKQMTIATWVTIASINESYWGCCLIGNDWAEGKCVGAWQITPDGCFAIGGTVRTSLSTTPPLLPWQERGSRRWRHLAVVIDPPHGHAACYLDGQKAYETKAPTDAASIFESATIGNWWGLNQKYERGLCGRMSEFMILARAMADEEIHEMYEAGTP